MMDHDHFDDRAARGLGIASLGIGLAEIAAPKHVEQMLGLPRGRHTGTLRILGIREILSGLDILSHRNPTTGVWARVAGDVLDLALLGAATRATRRPQGLIGAIAMVAGVTAMDVICAKRLSTQEERGWSRYLPHADGMGRTFRRAREGMSEAWEGVGSTAGRVWDGAQSLATRALNRVSSWGQQIPKAVNRMACR